MLREGRIRRYSRVALTMAMLGLLLLAGCGVIRRPVKTTGQAVYFPLVTKGEGKTLHGVELAFWTEAMNADLEFVHSQIVRTWILYSRAPERFSDGLSGLDQAGQLLLVTVKGSSTCFLAEAEWDPFFDWLSELAAMYPQVDIWEAWNEPDVPSDLCAIPFFGGWNVAPGAETYARFVSRFYEVIHQANPEAKVMVGSFMIDNLEDPTITGFIETVLRTASYDAVGFHKYQWYGVAQEASIANLARKYEWLRSIARPGSPIYLTETSDLNDGDCEDEDFQEHQADWLEEVNRYADQAGIAGVIWYGLYIDWRCSAMVDGGPREVFFRAHEVNGR